MSIQLIVGLGNPGPEYSQTRHNAGTSFVLHLLHNDLSQLKADRNLHAWTARYDAPERVMLAIPQSYMNESGRAVQALMHFYKIPPEALLVVHDELDLPPGTARLKTGGGHGGHNGLRSIIQCTGSRDFHRLRIGIGHPGDRNKVSAYVLKKPGQDDAISIERSIMDAERIVPDLLEGNMAQAMKHLHTP